ARVDTQPLNDVRAFANAPPKLDDCSFGPRLANTHAFQRVDFARLGREVGVNVPGVEIDWLVFEDDQVIGHLARWHDVAQLALVPQACDTSVFVPRHLPERSIDLALRGGERAQARSGGSRAQPNGLVAVGWHAPAPHPE